MGNTTAKKKKSQEPSSNKKNENVSKKLNQATRLDEEQSRTNHQGMVTNTTIQTPKFNNFESPPSYDEANMAPSSSKSQSSSREKNNDTFKPHAATLTSSTSNDNADYDKQFVTAASNNDLETMKRLFKENSISNIDCLMELKTAMIYASFYGFFDIVRFLTENGADVNKPNKYNTPPIGLAASRGHLEIVKYLVEHNASVDIRGQDNLNLLEMAETSNDDEVIFFVKNLRNNMGTTEMQIDDASHKDDQKYIAKIADGESDADGMRPVVVKSNSGEEMESNILIHENANIQVDPNVNMVINGKKVDPAQCQQQQQ